MKTKYLAGLFLVGIVETSNASIININARTNTTTNPVVMHLPAGDYDVTPIGVADGGAYNAWNAWGFVSLPSAGWLNFYSLSSPDFAYNVGGVGRYSTDLLALANAVGTSFTLASDENVSFYIQDPIYSDNIGGMSLDVSPAPNTPVPEPATMLLMSTGIVSLAAGTRFRRKKH